MATALSAAVCRVLLATSVPDTDVAAERAENDYIFGAHIRLQNPGHRERVLMGLAGGCTDPFSKAQNKNGLRLTIAVNRRPILRV